MTDLSNLCDLEKLLATLRRNKGDELRMLPDARPAALIAGKWHEFGNRPLTAAEVRSLATERLTESQIEDALAGQAPPIPCDVPGWGAFELLGRNHGGRFALSVFAR